MAFEVMGFSWCRQVADVSKPELLLLPGLRQEPSEQLLGDIIGPLKEGLLSRSLRRTCA